MADDTTAQAQASPGAQQREHADPTERSQPIPLLAAVVTVAALLFGVGYLIFAEPPGAPTLGDRRTLDDLRGLAANQPGAAGVVDGKPIFAAQCVACHQATGLGLPGVFPPLAGSEWVLGDQRIVVHILLLHGIAGEITVAGVVYKGNMPAFKQLADAELAAVSSHVRAA